MKQKVIKYGLISGVVIAVLMVATVPFVLDGPIDPSSGQAIGYTTMVLSFLAVFFGIRAYRDQEGGGAITFGKAFKVGILIALIGCAFYVAVWQVMYWGFFSDFGEKYAAATIERMQAEGKPAAEIEKTREQMATFARLYRNPFFNIAVTFVEIFPVGLIMTLISAAILRRRHGEASAPALA